MKKLVLALLLAYIVDRTPWTLLALTAEAMVLRPNLTRVVKGNDQYWQVGQLQGRLKSLGWSVSYKPHLSYNGVEVYGLTDTDERTIIIDGDLEWNTRYAVLAHEGGHTLQPGWHNYEMEECFAEAVATLVAGGGIREHARYLAAHKASLLMLLLFDSARVYHAAAVLQD